MPNVGDTGAPRLVNTSHAIGDNESGEPSGKCCGGFGNRVLVVVVCPHEFLECLDEDAGVQEGYDGLVDEMEAGAVVFELCWECGEGCRRGWIEVLMRMWWENNWD